VSKYDGRVLRVRGLDHVVFNVSNVEKSLRWYVEELGLQPERVEEWRRGEVLFPSVRIDSGTIIDLFAAPRSGENCNHVCVVVEETDFDALAASGRFDVVDGPAQRWGARGDGTSLYVRDPDGNVVELRYYSR
jgi:catechol 2,3-dioxygenase-like lactoylglutathione lyase family enzyme